jgi:NAD(P)-dependent dehydrogenase (short-subunit alcohol dehydrogenase family)
LPGTGSEKRKDKELGDLENKAGIVTGGGRGLGQACCDLIAREGGKVIVADVSEEGGAETVARVSDAGGEAVFVRTDVSKSEDVQAMVTAAIDSFGRLDFAINNAMRPPPFLPLAELSEEDWDSTIAVNLTGVFLCMKYEIKAMLEQGGGAIVNVGSGNEHGAAPGCAAYIAAKRGLLGLTAVGTLDYGEHNIRVNAVGPGTMVTPAMRHGIGGKRETQGIPRKPGADQALLRSARSRRSGDLALL